MDISTLIELYGLPGLIIGGLGWAYLAERSERKDTQEKRISESREHSKELYETIQTVRDLRRGGAG